MTMDTKDVGTFLGALVNTRCVCDYAVWTAAAWCMLHRSDQELYFWHVLCDTLRLNWGEEDWSKYKAANPKEYKMLACYLRKWRVTLEPTQDIPDLGVNTDLTIHVAPSQEWVDHVSGMMDEDGAQCSALSSETSTPVTVEERLRQVEEKLCHLEVSLHNWSHASWIQWQQDSEGS